MEESDRISDLVARLEGKHDLDRVMKALSEMKAGRGLNGEFQRRLYGRYSQKNINAQCYQWKAFYMGSSVWCLRCVAVDGVEKVFRLMNPELHSTQIQMEIASVNREVVISVIGGTPIVIKFPVGETEESKVRAWLFACALKELRVMEQTKG